jgi:predicted Zn-dependent peptidase
MNWLGEQWLGYGHIQSPEETKHRFGSVTPSQIRAVAQAVFRQENLHLAMVSPWKDEKAIRPFLRF